MQVSGRRAVVGVLQIHIVRSHDRATRDDARDAPERRDAPSIREGEYVRTGRTTAGTNRRAKCST